MYCLRMSFLLEVIEDMGCIEKKGWNSIDKKRLKQLLEGLEQY